jgi:hypothetical protein
MKLKDRRHYQIMQRMRDILMESEKFIDVLIQSNELMDPLKGEFENDELLYTIRLLVKKGYFEPGDSSSSLELVKLTIKGFDEWLFPFGKEDFKRVFLSYAIEDKLLAGKIKRKLEEGGLSVFLAHNDIKATAEFRDRIIAELYNCGIFIALRTKKYSKPYTEQECGFALALEKRILSLCVDTSANKMGFCSVYQGHKFNGKKSVDQIASDVTSYCLKQLSESL